MDICVIRDACDTRDVEMERKGYIKVLTKISSLLLHIAPPRGSSGAKDLDMMGACCISQSCALLSCIELALKIELNSNIMFASKLIPPDDNADAALLSAGSFIVNVLPIHVPDADTGWLLSRLLKSKGWGGMGTPSPSRATAYGGRSSAPAAVVAVAEAVAEADGGV